MLWLELGQGEATVNEGSRQGCLPPARLQKQRHGREPAAARGCNGARVGARNGGRWGEMGSSGRGRRRGSTGSHEGSLFLTVGAAEAMAGEEFRGDAVGKREHKGRRAAARLTGA